MARVAVLIDKEQHRQLKQLALDKYGDRFQDMVRDAVLALLTSAPPDGTRGLRQTPDWKALKELITSMQTISKISTEAADALGEIVSTLRKEAGSVPETLSDASADELDEIGAGGIDQAIGEIDAGTGTGARGAGGVAAPVKSSKKPGMK